MPKRSSGKPCWRCGRRQGHMPRCQHYRGPHKPRARKQAVRGCALQKLEKLIWKARGDTLWLRESIRHGLTFTARRPITELVERAEHDARRARELETRYGTLGWRRPHGAG